MPRAISKPGAAKRREQPLEIPGPTLATGLAGPDNFGQPSRPLDPPGGSGSFPGDVHAVVGAQGLLEEREELRVGTVIGHQLERVAIDEVVLIFLVLFFKLLDEERQLFVGDLADIVSGIDPGQLRHGGNLPAAPPRGQREDPC